MSEHPRVVGVQEAEEGMDEGLPGDPVSQARSVLPSVFPSKLSRSFHDAGQPEAVGDRGGWEGHGGDWSPLATGGGRTCLGPRMHESGD